MEQRGEGGGQLALPHHRRSSRRHHEHRFVSSGWACIANVPRNTVLCEELKHCVTQRTEREVGTFSTHSMPFHQYGGSTPNVSRYWICAAGLGITYSIAPPGFPSSGRARRPETPVQSVITPRVTNSRLFTSGSPRLARGSPTSPDPSASTSDHRSGSPRPRHGTRSRRRPRLPRPNEPLQRPRLPLWRRPGDIISCRCDFRDLLDGDVSDRDGHPRRSPGVVETISTASSPGPSSAFSQHREDATSPASTSTLRRYQAGGSQPTLDALKNSLSFCQSALTCSYHPARARPRRRPPPPLRGPGPPRPDERKLVRP